MIQATPPLLSASTVAGSRLPSATNRSRMEFPPGFRFCPTDGELIVNYLKEQIEKKTTPFNIIHHVCLLNAYTPQELTGSSPKNTLLRENEWYFFTSRNRKYLHGRRPDRQTVDGFWKPTGVEKPVIHEGHTVGYKKALDYYSGHQRNGGNRTDWKMHEYRIHQTGSAPSRNANGEMNKQLDEWVLCRIYLSSRRKKGDEQEDVVSENAGRGQDVQVNEAILPNQNSNLVDPTPTASTAADHTFTGKVHYQPSCNFQFQQNNFITQNLSAGLNGNMFEAVAPLEPNYPILASSDFNNHCMDLKPITGDIDDADLFDVMNDRT